MKSFGNGNRLNQGIITGSVFLLDRFLLWRICLLVLRNGISKYNHEGFKSLSSFFRALLAAIENICVKFSFFSRFRFVFLWLLFSLAFVLFFLWLLFSLWKWVIGLGKKTNLPKLFSAKSKYISNRSKSFQANIKSILRAHCLNYYPALSRHLCVVSIILLQNGIARCFCSYIKTRDLKKVDHTRYLKLGIILQRCESSIALPFIGSSNGSLYFWHESTKLKKLYKDGTPKAFRFYLFSPGFVLKHFVQCEASLTNTKPNI